jgi:hypothetical protein
MNDRKKPGAAFWTAVLVVVLGLYVGSFGPACRIYEDGYLDARSVWLAYRPLTWLFYRGPQPVCTAIGSWVRLFRSPDRAAGSSPPDPICIEWHVQNPGVF